MRGPGFGQSRVRGRRGGGWACAARSVSGLNAAPQSSSLRVTRPRDDQQARHPNRLSRTNCKRGGRKWGGAERLRRPGKARDALRRSADRGPDRALSLPLSHLPQAVSAFCKSQPQHDNSQNTITRDARPQHPYVSLASLRLSAHHACLLIAAGPWLSLRPLSRSQYRRWVSLPLTGPLKGYSGLIA